MADAMMMYDVEVRVEGDDFSRTASYVIEGDNFEEAEHKAERKAQEDFPNLKNRFIFTRAIGRSDIPYGGQ